MRACSDPDFESTTVVEHLSITKAPGRMTHRGTGPPQRLEHLLLLDASTAHPLPQVSRPDIVIGGLTRRDSCHQPNANAVQLNTDSDHEICGQPDHTLRNLNRSTRLVQPFPPGSPAINNAENYSLPKRPPRRNADTCGSNPHERLICAPPENIESCTSTETSFSPFGRSNTTTAVTSLPGLMSLRNASVSSLA